LPSFLPYLSSLKTYLKFNHGSFLLGLVALTAALPTHSAQIPAAFLNSTNISIRAFYEIRRDLLRMDLTAPSERKHLVLRLRALRAQCAASNRFIETYLATRSNPRAPKVPTTFFATEMHKFFSNPAKVARALNDPTFLFLLDQPSLSPDTINALGTITALILVKNYTPQGLDFSQLTHLEKLVMLDGEMTPALRTAVQNLAKGPKTLQYLHIPRWGSPIIPDSAFEQAALRKIDGFKDITSFGSYAFSNCQQLVTLMNTDNITRIGTYTFYRCHTLSGALSFPNVTTSLGARAFCDCVKVASIYLPKVTGNIQIFTFSYCFELASLTLNPANPCTLASNAFWNCYALLSFSLPNAIAQDLAFRDCNNLTTVELANATIPLSGAFPGCTALTSLTLHNLTSITSNPGFGNYPLTTVSFPNLTSITVKSIFADHPTITTVSMPKLGGTLPDTTFCRCAHLTSVDMSNSTVTYIAYAAFYGCGELATLQMNLNKLTRIAGEGFSGCMTLARTLSFPNVTKLDAGYTFWRNELVTSISLPKFTGKLFVCMFYGCISLQTVDLSTATVTQIDDRAFAGCCSLTTLLINTATVLYVAPNAFDGCVLLEIPTFPNAT
ncbi:MAG: leucine-rich repeat domain-containing protein, partial [Holosporales bacterium]|nr:leucine-rich repeat domain-containing protein [Holosporales bacterium]